MDGAEEAEAGVKGPEEETSGAARREVKSRGGPGPSGQTGVPCLYLGLYAMLLRTVRRKGRGRGRAHPSGRLAPGLPGT